MNAIDVAEDVMASAKIDAAGKARILLALLRSTRHDATFHIDSERDVLQLALCNPDGFKRILRGFWLLVPGGAADAADALASAERGSCPTEAQLRDESVRAAWPKADGAISRYIARNKLTATGLLAVGIVRGQAA